MTIQTERLTLRPVRPRDVKPTLAYSRDPENAAYMPSLPLLKKRETMQYCMWFMLNICKQWKKKSRRRYDFAVVLDGKHIGAVSVLPDKKNHRRGELTWIIQKAHWGKGYATEAAKAAMDFALQELEVDCLHAKCDYRNDASRRVMEKIGLLPEPDCNAAWRCKGSNEWTKVLIYSLTI